jgi:mannonate dehydratase
MSEFLRPALLLTELTDANLRLAAQCGATDIVGPCPGFEEGALTALVQRIQSFGLKLSVIERFVPHDKIVHNLPGRDEQVENIKTLIRQMGQAGVECLCYNWMPSDDWTRTAVDVPVRGGALSTAFDLTKAPLSLSGHKSASSITGRDQLWENLETFLKEVIPVCEANNVTLALHPDDPPLSLLHGQPQICYSTDELVKVVKLVPSSANGICFCQGTFASAGEDIPSGIRKLGPAIKFIHFRNVICDRSVDDLGSKFQETWQDTGDINNVEALKAYREVCPGVVIRPDHVPTLEGEDNSNPGYHVLGRLWALGYIKGLMQGLDQKEGKTETKN